MNDYKLAIILGVGAFIVGAPRIMNLVLTPADIMLDQFCVKYAARHSTTPERACQRL